MGFSPEVLNKTLAEYKNPQQEPGAERRLLLVFVLTFVVLIIFQPLLKTFFPQPPTPPQTQNQPVPAQPATVAPAPTPSAPAAAVTTNTVTTNTITKQTA